MLRLFGGGGSPTPLNGTFASRNGSIIRRWVGELVGSAEEGGDRGGEELRRQDAEGRALIGLGGEGERMEERDELTQMMMIVRFVLCVCGLVGNVDSRDAAHRCCSLRWNGISSWTSIAALFMNRR